MIWYDVVRVIVIVSACLLVPVTCQLKVEIRNNRDARRS